MPLEKNDILKLLDEKEIPYVNIDHPAVYNMDEMRRLGLPDTDRVAKNLFLKDDRKHYYLVTLKGDRRLSMKELRAVLGTRPLTFAKAEELAGILGLIAGEVTPFGLLNDQNRQVTMVFDTFFAGGKIGVHPVDNTASVYLAFGDLVRAVSERAKEVVFLDRERMSRSHEPPREL